MTITFGIVHYYGQSVRVDGMRVGTISFNSGSELSFYPQHELKNTTIPADIMIAVAEKIAEYRNDPMALVHTAMNG